MSLQYPAYLYWPTAQAFYQLSSLEDLEASFGWNDVKHSDLTGWDSLGQRFTLDWDDALHLPLPKVHERDYSGLAEAAHLFYEQRRFEESLFIDDDVVDGECSLRAVRQFCQSVLLCAPKKP